MVIIPMAAIKNNLVVIFSSICVVLVLSLCFLSPLVAIAENSYGECAYGNQTYQGNCPTLTPPMSKTTPFVPAKTSSRGYAAKEVKLLQKFLAKILKQRDHVIKFRISFANLSLENFSAHF